MRGENLEEKRKEVLIAIVPICKAFGIKDFDYIVNSEKGTETLKLEDTLIGCSLNSVSAVIDEIIGWLFVYSFCRNRSIGAFKTQTLNVVKRYWKKEDTANDK